MEHVPLAPGSFRAASAMLLCGLPLAATPAFGASQRTFVASTGVDLGNLTCSLALPCRTFNTAIANTLAGGEVVILDTAGYGPMTIDKSIKIIGPSGVYGRNQRAGWTVPDHDGRHDQCWR